MAISQSGTNFFDPSAGSYVVGDNAAGTYSVDAGTRVQLAQGTSGNIELSAGFGPNGNGNVTVATGGAIDLDADGLADLAVGDEGASGTVAIRSGGSIFATSGTGTFGRVGSGAFADGTLIVDDASLDLNSTGGPAGLLFALGDPDASSGANGFGFVTDDAVLSISASGSGNAGAFLQIGSSGRGEGRLFVTDSTVLVSSDAGSRDAVVNVGVAGSTGLLRLDASYMQVAAASSDAFAAVYVGRNDANSLLATQGTATVDNGSTLLVQSAGTADLSIGRVGTAGGVLDVRGGSRVVVNSDLANQDAFAAVVNVAASAGGEGELNIVGVGSEVETNGVVAVGPGPGLAQPAQDAFVSVRAGGLIDAAQGTLVGGNGTVVLEGGEIDVGGRGLLIEDGGTLAVGYDQTLPSRESLVTGNIRLEAGSTVAFRIGSDTLSGRLDHVGTNFFGADGYTLLVDTDFDGYTFEQGDRYVLATSTAMFVVNEFDIRTSFEVTGQSAQFAYAVENVVGPGGISINFVALTDGAGTGTARLDLGSSSPNGANVLFETDTGFVDATGGLSGVDGGVSAANVDEVSATAVADRIELTGSAGGAVIAGGGDDYVVGSSGNDTLNGGTGADVLAGNLGDDVYIVDDGRDRVFEAGGAGFDVMQFVTGGTLADNVEQGVLLASAGSLNGDGFSAILIGNGQSNLLSGNEGANFISGGGGSNLIYGAGGDDQLLGGSSADLLSGQAGDDSIIGGDGSDILLGDAGADTLDGGAGADALYGDFGNDTFRIGAVAFGEQDTIFDYGAEGGIGGTGADRIGLQAFNYGALGADVDINEFVLGTQSNSDNAQIIFDTSTGRLFYDADGTGAGAQFHIANVNFFSGSLDFTDFDLI